MTRAETNSAFIHPTSTFFQTVCTNSSRTGQLEECSGDFGNGLKLRAIGQRKFLTWRNPVREQRSEGILSTRAIGEIGAVPERF